MQRQRQRQRQRRLQRSLRYRPIPTPADSTLHALQRFTSGYAPELYGLVQAAGGFAPWFDRQLAGGYDDSWYHETSRWWVSINATEAQLWQRMKDGIEPFWRADANYQCWALLRRYGSQRQVQEVMAEFWEHHFHVPAVGAVGPYRAAYGKALRDLALTSFEQLLQAAITHPAMALYLSNANASPTAPNENLGRELLELHTVGVGNYTEDDVKASARLLTGFRMNAWTDWRYWFDQNHHWTGPLTVLGHRFTNSTADAKNVPSEYLRFLAHHPDTARHVALKLARHFVSDSPSDSLVQHLSRVYLDNGTRIPPVLKALIASSEFKRSVGAKIRNPTEDLVATYRSLGVRFTTAPTNSFDVTAANATFWQAHALGLTPFGWSSPDGRPSRGESWSSTSRFLASLELHYTMSAGRWPRPGAAYRPFSDWIPQTQIHFADLVDHLSRVILGREATPLLFQVASEATGCEATEVITAQHRIVRSEMPRLLTLFLDSPYHMTR